MEQDRPRRGPRSAKASAGKALRRERARERERERHRFPPLRITGAPSVDERLVVVAPPRSALSSGAAAAINDTPDPASPLGQLGEQDPGAQPPPAAAGQSPADLPRPARVDPATSPPAQAPPRRSASTRLGPIPALGLSPNPDLASVARLAGARARPEDFTDREAADGPPSWRSVFGPVSWLTASSGKRLRPPTWTACELRRNS